MSGAQNQGVSESWKGTRKHRSNLGLAEQPGDKKYLASLLGLNFHSGTTGLEQSQ